MTFRPDWPYPRVVAHRGGGTLAPENTLAALDEGARRGHAMVEFDAKLSADDVTFLLHDDTVDRTSDGHGSAAAMRYAELAALDAGAWFDARFAGERMPTFEAAAARCVALGLMANVEIKPCPGRERETGRRVAADAAAYWRDAAVPPLLSSFSFDALQQARETAPELPRGMLYEAVPDDWYAQAVDALGCVSLHADHTRLDEPLVRAIKAAGLRILVYTVNDPERVRELVRWGVDAVCTDRIDLIGPHALDGIL
ncbi:glycerophosphodiester phosphodiesterase [Burkholderia ubonensis]|uniref:glycerophosphodiester phosphodiesterase n=1 Tax=Burkholderia ubonensis TaxID=101571 RepID=UPI000758097B|nr:glycerophosphodiester phosphodiesterase [Burkholderia ubonensis]KVP41964.1 glycerophosphoryl diester phosphodiesterase [Burkholderia ubonensis]KVQ74352.1 glycerophosphoryl diester phosphodiesterase [Burkholderia ubonensis]KVR13771.1 glycerophosphoryl diester phosphodiesterase [Burkholderia ubonensis]KWD32493.1 glycerophosphoryl diester phosphodiesterase [Burkholderia ubonensis]KWD40610.1 glycerophosphoryl diester phosphodiesterase [Burkholderia ubonensis]